MSKRPRRNHRPAFKAKIAPRQGSRHASPRRSRHRAVSRETPCLVRCPAVASADDEAQPIPVLQDEPGDHPPRGDALHPVPAFPAERRGHAARARHRVHHESVRFWWNRFGPIFAAEIRRRRIARMRQFHHWQWHLDEMFVRINGETHYLWRAVDHEGEVLEAFVSKRRDRTAALKFLRKALRRHGRPEIIVTDRLRSYGAALRAVGAGRRQRTGRWLNNRAENTHQPLRRRERAMQRFRRMGCLQKFASAHASIHNHFSQERHLTPRNAFKLKRDAALAEWPQLGIA
jgi:putative transposase